MTLSSRGKTPWQQNLQQHCHELYMNTRPVYVITHITYVLDNMLQQCQESQLTITDTEHRILRICACCYLLQPIEQHTNHLTRLRLSNNLTSDELEQVMTTITSYQQERPDNLYAKLLQQATDNLVTI